MNSHPLHVSTSEFAISSLENLNDQISHFVFSKRTDEDPEPLKSSVLQMRDLLREAHLQFSKMEDNKRILAAKIDGNLQQTNEQVMTMKAELQRLVMVTKNPRNSEGKSEMMEMENMKRENAKLTEELEKTRNALHQEKELNQKLTNNNDTTTEQKEMKAEIIQLKQELNHCREKIRALTMDRKLLRIEKLDVLGQMRQLYGTLEDKERELKEFINNYKQRITESENIIKQTANDLKEHNDALKFEIENKDLIIEELRRSVAILSQQKPLDRSSKDSLTDESLRSINGQSVEPISLSSVETLTSLNDLGEISPTSRRCDERIAHNKLSRKVTWSTRNESGATIEGGSDAFYPSIGSQDAASHESCNDQFGSAPLLEVSKSQISIGDLNASFLSDEEKVRILADAKETKPIFWKANHVRAWLELEVHMPGYGKACSENIRSGRVLLSLSDSELNSFLCLQSPLHRRKLRLAIDELRQPEFTSCPLVSTVTPAWVANYWLPSLGLPQFGSTFETQLVDGRLLNVLSKKDLEKHLSVLQKLHQTSILCGIKLLKSLSFDKRMLTERRTKAIENGDDIIVWTNEQVVNWVKSIDLAEFAENLRSSGIHGSLIVLDSNFTVDVLTRELNIPSSKVPVLRHLSTELKLLLAKATTKTRDSSNPPKKSNLTRSPFIRSFRGGKSSADDLSRQNRGSEKSFTWRGSLGRAFSKKLSKDQIQVIRSDQTVVKNPAGFDVSAQHDQSTGGRKSDRLI